jgi:hypothetical protein
MMSISKLLLLIAAVACVIIPLLLFIPRSAQELPQDKFVEVYVELSLVKQMFASDSLKLAEEQTRIFKETGISQTELDEFVNRLSEEPERWAEVWKKVVEKLEQRRQALSSP